MRRGFGLMWGALTVAIAGAAAYFAYGAGWAAGAATRLPAGGAWVGPYPYYGYWHGGFGFGGFIGFVLILLLFFWILRIGRWRRGGYRGGFAGGFDEWHRRAHEGSGPGPGASTGGGSAAGSAAS